MSDVQTLLDLSRKAIVHPMCRACKVLVRVSVIFGIGHTRTSLNEGLSQTLSQKRARQILRALPGGIKIEFFRVLVNWVASQVGRKLLNLLFNELSTHIKNVMN